MLLARTTKARAAVRSAAVLSQMRTFSGGFPKFNDGETRWERAWKPTPPKDFKYDPNNPKQKAFGRLHDAEKTPCYALESEDFDEIDSLDQKKRFKPQGRLECRNPAYGWFPRTPEEQGMPDDVSLLMPAQRSGQFMTQGPYDPKAWVENGAPLGLQVRAWPEFYSGAASRWPHAHYEKAESNRMTRHNEDATGYRDLHLRADERTTAFQKWFHRKLDERFVDFGSKHFWTVWNVHLPQIIVYTVAIVVGILSHFKKDAPPTDPLPLNDYLMRNGDEALEIDIRSITIPKPEGGH